MDQHPVDQRLIDYARLVVEVGVNVQKGEPVVITAPVQAADFVRLLARFAYKREASEVVVDWRDQEITKMTYDHAPMEVLKTVPDFLYDKDEYYYKRGANMISVASSDPDAFAQTDPERLAAASRAFNKKMKPLDHYTMNDEVAWCVAAYPNVKWARKVFPKAQSDDEAYALLMEAILKMSRMEDADPVQAWKDHIARLSARAKILNDYQFDKVHYRSENGTDLTVHLPQGHIWMAASSLDDKGNEFVPNIPTEEIFSLPHADKVDGTLVASKPLVYHGQVINNFSFTFKDGAVTDFRAEQGQEVLKNLLDEDEGSRRLGEIALVPYASPISESGILFYNTLFDENASCHFALGACYPTCLEGGADLTSDQVRAQGGNDSAVHVDFMVGTKDLSIIGTTKDGQEVAIFKEGNFCF